MCFDPTIGYYNHWQGQNHQANLQIVKFQTFGIGFSDSLPLYQIGGKRVSFCVAFLMLLALFLIPVKTFARYEIIDEMRYNIIDDYAVLASNTDWKYTGDIVVPQKATASDGKKYPVTALEEGCYRDCKTVTSVLLP